MTNYSPYDSTLSANFYSFDDRKFPSPSPTPSPRGPGPGYSSPITYNPSPLKIDAAYGNKAQQKIPPLNSMRLVSLGHLTYQDPDKHRFIR